MNTLVLSPGGRTLAYSVFAPRARRPITAGEVDAEAAPMREALIAVLSTLRDETLHRHGWEPELVAVRLRYGGQEFERPVQADSEELHLLNRLAGNAPLHIPPTIELVRSCRELLPGVAVTLVSDTAFFACLAARERLYALDPGISSAMGVRRYGFHGLLHKAACAWARSQLIQNDSGAAPAMLSICLEPKPEVASVLGHRPVAISGGATPLEGIPGQTSCGDLDAGAVLAMARQEEWGPERINALLTCQSGLKALAGEPVTVAQALSTQRPGLRLARDVLRYRILLACGAGIAAMGGLDALVFSGRYADAGRELGAWLEDRLRTATAGRNREPGAYFFREPADRAAADEALAAWRATGGGHVA